MALNREAYTVEADNLIYDAKHPIDAANVQVGVTADKDGTIRRGQLLYVKDGVYSAAKSDDNEPAAIAAQTASYASDDTDIVVTAYISGTFRQSGILSDAEITPATVEALRAKGIYLK